MFLLWVDPRVYLPGPRTHWVFSMGLAFCLALGTESPGPVTRSSGLGTQKGTRVAVSQTQSGRENVGAALCLWKLPRRAQAGSSTRCPLSPASPSGVLQLRMFPLGTLLASLPCRPPPSAQWWLGPVLHSATARALLCHTGASRNHLLLSFSHSGSTGSSHFSLLRTGPDTREAVRKYRQICSVAD